MTVAVHCVMNATTDITTQARSAMSQAVYDHNHTYVAVTNRLKQYRCTKPGCVHTIPASLMVGRKAECPSCEILLTITSEHLRRKTIACIGCGVANLIKVHKAAAHVPTPTPTTQAAKDILSKI